MDYITPFIKWLLQSDYLKNNKLFLNALNAQDSNIQIVTEQIATNNIVEYVDGSERKTINFTIFDYKSISFNQLVKTMIDMNENVTDLLDVGKIAEFVLDMNKKKNFPDFGKEIEVQSILPVYETPSTPTIDTTNSPNLAKYSIPIVCTFISYENAI